MSSFEFSFDRPRGGSPTRRSVERLRVLVIGDLRGANSARPALAERRPRHLTIDSFDHLMQHYSPTASIGGQADTFAVSFRSVEDFEPDALYSTVPLFADIRAARERNTVRDGPVAEMSSPAAGEEAIDDTLGRLLGKKAAPAQQEAGRSLDRFLKQIVVDDLAPREMDGGGVVAPDDPVHAAMRWLLHDPGVQRLEALWRGLHQLVTSVEDDETVEIFIMDVTEDEMTADLLSADPLHQGSLVSSLTEPGSAAVPEDWDFVVADICAGEDQLLLVGALGALVMACGGRLLADADLGQLAESPSDNWQHLRGMELAQAIALTTPRVLMRAPYGGQNDTVEAFDFEECPDAPAHDDLLWGSSALLVATCLIQSFQSASRGSLSDQEAASNRPVFVYDEDGVRVLQPVAERLLSDRQAEALRETWGVSPVIPERNGNRLYFATIESLAAA